MRGHNDVDIEVTRLRCWHFQRRWPLVVPTTKGRATDWCLALTTDPHEPDLLLRWPRSEVVPHPVPIVFRLEVLWQNDFKLVHYSSNYTPQFHVRQCFAYATIWAHRKWKECRSVEHKFRSSRPSLWHKLIWVYKIASIAVEDKRWYLHDHVAWDEAFVDGESFWWRNALGCEEYRRPEAH